MKKISKVFGKEKKKIACNLLNGIIFTAIAVGLFYLMEFYEHNPFVEVRPTAQFFNGLLFALAAWFFFFLFGSARISIRILAAISMVFGLINHYVVLFRSTPLVPWDFRSANTAVTVMGNYDYTPSFRVVLVTILFLSVIAFVWFLPLKWEKKLPARLVLATVVCAMTCLFSHNLQQESFQLANNLYPFLFTPAYMTKVNGMAVTFVMDLAYVNVRRPLGYSKEEAAWRLMEYDKESTIETTEDLPNIIVIMDEAFSDPAVLGDFATNEDYMPFVHSLMDGADNTVTGTLHVSVCGGNTANTEFEFLTGNTMAFLPMGSIPYQQYIKSDTASYAAYARSLGYATVAMHPYHATGWSRDEVYPRIGFEETYFQPDMSRLTYLRGYVSDASDFRNIVAQYETKEEGKPLFLFNVTMQNHGSYVDLYENFTPEITVSGSTSVALSQYLSLLRETDESLEDLLSYFAGEEEKTLVIFFGDHQPADSVVAPIKEEANCALGENAVDTRRYEVPFVIWANYDIEEVSGVELSANYLAAYAFAKGGIPNSSYMKYLLELSEELPVVSAVENADDKRLEEYRKIQYYQLFDAERDDL